MRVIPTAAISLIENEEGFEPQAYQCQAGKWTVGFGSTFIDGHPVLPGMTITRERAEEATRKRVASDLAWIVQNCRVKLTDDRLAALLDFSYNFNVYTLKGSTLWLLLNKGLVKAAADELGKWVHYEDPHTHKMLVSDGLVKRRAKEKALFLQDK